MNGQGGALTNRLKIEKLRREKGLGWHWCGETDKWMKLPYHAVSVNAFSSFRNKLDKHLRETG